LNSQSTKTSFLFDFRNSDFSLLDKLFFLIPFPRSGKASASSVCARASDQPFCPLVIFWSTFLSDGGSEALRTLFLCSMLLKLPRKVPRTVFNIQAVDLPCRLVKDRTSYDSCPPVLSVKGAPVLDHSEALGFAPFPSFFLRQMVPHFWLCLKGRCFNRSAALPFWCSRREIGRLIDQGPKFPARFPMTPAQLFHYESLHRLVPTSVSSPQAFFPFPALPPIFDAFFCALPRV